MGDVWSVYEGSLHVRMHKTKNAHRTNSFLQEKMYRGTGEIHKMDKQGVYKNEIHRYDSWCI